MPGQGHGLLSRVAKHRRRPLSTAGQQLLIVWTLLCICVAPALSQKFCRIASQSICDRCPNKCPASGVPEGQAKCEYVPHNVKCERASWGNTNSTFMNLECRVPPGVPQENYPSITIQDPVFESPLICEGTVLKGLWSFRDDRDNMTFSLETMYRDPEKPTQSVKDVFLSCVSFLLTPVSSGANDDPNTPEATLCPITINQRESNDYSGLSLFVCVGTATSRDPYCRQGRWEEVVVGACIGETVAADLEITDESSRMLVRLGGPYDLTGCQVKWKLEVTRSQGSCSSMKRGFGSCCQQECANGRKLFRGSCQCVCPIGFVGPFCDRLAPHLVIDLVLFNKTKPDWVVSSAEEIGAEQLLYQYYLSTSLARVLGIPSINVEFDSAEDQSNLGTGMGGYDGFYAERPREGGRRRELLQELAPHCQATPNMDVSGVGLSKVRVRVIATFEHELSSTRALLEAELERGSLEAALGNRSIYLCILDVTLRSFNSFGFPMSSKTLVAPSNTIATSTVLLIIFALIAVLVVFCFAFIQFYSSYAVEKDRMRHLTEYKPVTLLAKQGLSWSFVEPSTNMHTIFPAAISRQLEAAYTTRWLHHGESLYEFEWDESSYTADFSLLRFTENTSGAHGFVTRVLDGMTLLLDNGASAANHHYVNRAIQITGIPPNEEARMLGQERLIVAYAGATREVKVESSFLPPLVAGCEYRIGGKKGVQFRRLVPPGLEEEGAARYEIPERPPKGHVRKYKKWKEETGALAQQRLQEELHYPTVRAPPPNTQKNMPRIQEIHMGQALKEEKALARSQNRKKTLGKVNRRGVHTFSGDELRGWQRDMHQSYEAVEVEKNTLLLEDDERRATNAAERQLTLQNEGVVVDEAFKRELFLPGSSAEMLTSMGVRTQSFNAANFSKSFKKDAVDTGAALEETDKERLSGVRKKKKKSKKEERDWDDIYDEVAV